MTSPSSPISYTVSDAVRATGIGRTKLYYLAREGRVEMVKVGTRTLVTERSLRKLIEGQAS